MDMRAYCEAEIARLEILERETRDQLMAVRGGLAAYRDVLAQQEVAPASDLLVRLLASLPREEAA
jgi:hypothetical protein